MTFENFWEDELTKKEAHNIEDENLPRKRNTQKRLTESYVEASEQEFQALKDMYRARYFETYDFVITSTKERFNQSDYRMYATMQNIILKGIRGEEVESEIIKAVTGKQSFQSLYKDGIDTTILAVQLKVLRNLLKANDTTHQNIPFVVKQVRNLSLSRRIVISEVIKVLKLILLAPATNAESERIFSALKRVKTYSTSDHGREKAKRFNGVARTQR